MPHSVKKPVGDRLPREAVSAMVRAWLRARHFQSQPYLFFTVIWGTLLGLFWCFHFPDCKMGIKIAPISGPGSQWSTRCFSRWLLWSLWWCTIPVLAQWGWGGTRSLKILWVLRRGQISPCLEQWVVAAISEAQAKHGGSTHSPIP